MSSISPCIGSFKNMLNVQEGKKRSYCYWMQVVRMATVRVLFLLHVRDGVRRI